MPLDCQTEFTIDETFLQCCQTYVQQLVTANQLFYEKFTFCKSCNFQIDIFRWSVYRRPVFFPFLNIDCICCWIIEKVNLKPGLVYVHVLYPGLFLTVQENSLL